MLSYTPDPPCQLACFNTLSYTDTSSIYVSYTVRPRFLPCLPSSGDVGGQKTLRSYWRNYFEKTDALIWVVDATDRLRIEDCRDELHGLLQEEVFPLIHYIIRPSGGRTRADM